MTLSPTSSRGSSGGGAVSSVFTRTGAVVAANADYTPYQVGAMKGAFFDVTDPTYGADPTGATDATAAIQAAIAAAFSAGGGTVFVPRGTYKLSAAQSTGTGGGGYAYSGQLLIPAQAVTGQTIEIRLLGETPQSQIFWGPQAGTDMAAPTGCSILNSTATSGNVLDVIPGAVATLGVNFTNVSVISENLFWFVPNNPQCGGLKLRRAINASFLGSSIGPNISSLSISQPTHSTTGLVLPENNNDARIVCRDSQVFGFDTGVVHSEHAIFDGLAVQFCNVAVAPETGSHLSDYQRLLVQRCPRGFKPTQAINITGSCAIENGSTGWYATLLDFDDLNGYLTGSLDVCVYSSAIPHGYAPNLDLRNLRQVTNQQSGLWYPALRPVKTVATFQETDNANTLGQMDSGQLWYPGSGTFGTTSNKAYNPSTAGNHRFAYVVPHLSGQATPTTQATVTTSTANTLAGLLLKYIDQNNFVWVGFAKYAADGGVNQLQLAKLVGGTQTSLATAMAGSVATNHAYVLAAQWSGTQVVVSVDGATQITYNLSGAEQTLFNPAIRFGLYSFGGVYSDGGHRWAAFSCV